MTGGGATPGGIIPPIPPNKPGEPVFGLKLDPEAKLIFKGDNLVEAPTTIEVKLTNPTKDRQTFKVSNLTTIILNIQKTVITVNIF